MVSHELPLSLEPGQPCPACAAAEQRPFHLYYSGCLTCEIRSVSQAPKQLREAFYAQIADENERAAFKAAVMSEYQRRRAITRTRGKG